MKKILLLVSCLFLLLTCKTKEINMVTHQPIIEKNKFVSLYRSSCYGKCPSFKVTINGDGTFVYFGKIYVDNLGAHKGTISLVQIENLFSSLQKMDWDSFLDEYPIDNVDFPQFTIEYHNGLTLKKIRANSKADFAIINLAKNLDALIESVSMEKLN